MNLAAFIGVFGVFLVALVLAAVRRAHIRVEYSVIWLVAGITLIMLALIPSAALTVATVIGTSDHREALTIAVAAVFCLVLYALSTRISELKDSNIRLTQKLAILQYRIDQLENKN